MSLITSILKHGAIRASEHTSSRTTRESEVKRLEAEYQKLQTEDLKERAAAKELAALDAKMNDATDEKKDDADADAEMKDEEEKEDVDMDDDGEEKKAAPSSPVANNNNNNNNNKHKENPALAIARKAWLDAKEEFERPYAHCKLTNIL